MNNYHLNPLKATALLSALLALSAVSCNKEKADGTTVTVPPTRISATLGEVTKISHTDADSKLSLAWQENDRLRISSESASGVFTIQDGFGTQAAHFSGEGVPGSSYSILYPGSYASAEALAARDLSTQSQNGNGSVSHLEYNAILSGLGSYATFAFLPDWASGHGATLRQNSVFRFRLKMPAGVSSVSRITLSAGSDLFYSTNGGSGKTSSLVLNLSGVNVSSSSQIVNAYMNYGWQDTPLSAGTKILLTAETNAGTLEKTFAVKAAMTLGGGKFYTFQLNDSDWNDEADAILDDHAAETLYTDPETPDLTPALKILFIGNSFTQDAVWHLPDILKNMGFRKVKMIDCYIGGHLISEYESEFDSGTANNAYTATPENMAWNNKTGMTLKQICESEDWDVITLQEHTGNNCSWQWTDARKATLQSLVNKIKATQSKTPKMYYLMSQSYYDFAKMSGQSAYWTFSTQKEMYETCVAYAQHAVSEVGFDGIIPSGTYVQNIRTSGVNSPMDMTRDGYHMDYGLARYGAACLVYNVAMKPLLGLPLGEYYTYASSTINSTGHSTPVTLENGAVARQAAELAQANPWTITDMEGRDTQGGISNAAEMVDFALAVNNGEDLTRFQNAEGKIVLLNDIDLSSVRTWIPIGRCTMSWSSKTLKIGVGHPFTGHFDGQGHKIKNLTMLCDNAINYRAWGLFGWIGEGGVVENLVIDSSCKITFKPANQTEFGVVAGVVQDGTVRNVTNNADVTVSGFSATANQRHTVGLVGFAYAKSGCTLQNLVNNGTFTTSASSSSVVYYPGGIVGLTTNSNDATGTMLVKNCTFNGKLVSSASNPAAGIVSFVDMAGCRFEGCISKGTVITDRTVATGLVGTFFGQCNVAAAFSNCVSSAKIGTYNSGTWNYYTLSASNYMDYIGTRSSAATGVTSANIRFTE